MGWNASNGNLVGIAGTANPPANPFISIDTTTGNESILSANLQFPDLQGWISFVSTIDSVRNRFYAIYVDLGNGGPATLATLNSPARLVFDGLGNLDIADTANSRIRKVDTTGIITTTAGGGPSNQLVGIDTGTGTTSETLHLQNGTILLGSE